MKVLFLASSISSASETFIRDLINGLAAEGANLVVISGDPSIPDVVNSSSNTRVITAPFLALTRVTDRLKFLLTRRKQKWSITRDTVFDDNAARVLGKIIQEERPDVAYLEYGWTLARTAKVLSEHGVPMVAHVHGADLTTKMNEPGYAEALAKGIEAASAVIAASDHMRRLTILAGARPDQVHVVRLGVDAEKFVPVQWNMRRTSSPSIVFLGRMVPKKNPVALIEAFARVWRARPDAHLHMIGDGPELQIAEARANRLGILNEVTWHGVLERDQALEVLRDKWVYAQHSVTPSTGDQEGFGISIAEASALQLPVVSTFHNGIPEQITDGENGFLVQEYDFESMAKRMLELINSPDLCERMGQKGRDKVLRNYVPKVRASAIFQLLERVSQS